MPHRDHGGADRAGAAFDWSPALRELPNHVPFGVGPPAACRCVRPLRWTFDPARPTMTEATVLKRLDEYERGQHR